MGIKDILNKVFGNARENYDENGRVIVPETMEEQLLRKHLERERMKKVRATLKYYDRKHFKEMSSKEMPYHKYFKGRRR